MTEWLKIITLKSKSLNWDIVSSACMSGDVRMSQWDQLKMGEAVFSKKQITNKQKKCQNVKTHPPAAALPSLSWVPPTRQLQVYAHASESNLYYENYSFISVILIVIAASTQLPEKMLALNVSLNQKYVTFARNFMFQQRCG